MVINRNPRKAICFWRVLGEQQEHQFPDFILRQIWVTWDCLQLGWLRLLWRTFPCPLFVFSERSFPFTPHCWALVVLLYCLPFHLLHLKVCEQPRAEPGVGTSHGQLPWGGGEPSPPASASAKTCLPWTPLQRTFPAPFWKQSLVTLPYSAKAGLLERDLACPALPRPCLWASTLCNPE